MKRLLGGILLAVGILIMTGSGLCSLAVIVLSARSGGAMMLPYALVIGGIPFGAGFGLFRLGRWLARPAPPTPAELADPFE
jgi:hypothetical protein